MNKNKNLRSLTRPPLIVVLALMTLTACNSEDTAPIASPELLETGADQVIYKMVNILTVNGIQDARVEADTAFFYADSSVFSLRNATLILYTETGVERARVTSDRGRLKLDTKELLAQGNVILTIPEGNRQVETEELNYDPTGDRIWSDSPSIMREGNTVTRGQSFESDLEFRRATVYNGSITSTGDPPPPGRDTVRTPSGAPPVRTPSGL